MIDLHVELKLAVLGQRFHVHLHPVLEIHDLLALLLLLRPVPELKLDRRVELTGGRQRVLGAHVEDLCEGSRREQRWR